MAIGPRYKVAFRRRREGRTDYYFRLRLLRSGEARAVIRRSSKNLTVQFAEFNMGGDKILASATSKKLREMGWEHSCSSIPAAYLTGYMAGKTALKAGIEYAVVDMGPQKPQKGGVLFAALAGLCDAGMDIPHGDVFPAEDRLLGKHIDEGIEAEIESLKKKMEAE
ncbi:MAG: 50S ribosomal protein L18 [Candidatus Methanomethylophilaceae archaeon]